MDIPIYINGLLPITRDKRDNDDTGGSRIYVLITKQGMNDIEHIATADNNGECGFLIPEKYIEGDIRVHIRHLWYKGIQFDSKIKDYGFFYTAKIEHDYTFWSDSPSSDPEWNTEDEYIKAQSVKNQKLRDFRFKNRNAKVLYYLIVAISIVIGLVIPSGVGVVIALIIVIALEWISPYSLGLKRAIKIKPNKTLEKNS